MRINSPLLASHFGRAHRWLAALGVAVGIVMLISAVAPAGWWQAWLGRIRRPEDVTPERLWRLRAGLLTGGGLGSALAVLWWTQAARIGNATYEFVLEVGRVGRRRWFRPHSFTDLWPILILGFSLRAMRLQESMAYDEAYTFLSFARRPWYEAIADYNCPNNHLLNTFLMLLSHRCFGDSEWALRLPVFLAGGLLPAAMYVWVRGWSNRQSAVVAAALTAVAPALITYSVDARGYTLVLLLGILADHMTGRLRRPAPLWRLRCCGLVLALSLGLWAMPIMLYLVLGIVGWYLLEAIRAPQERLRRLWIVIGVGTGTAVLTGVLYAPAFLFRGLLVLRDPVMQPASRAEFGQLFLGSWRGGWELWTAGPTDWFASPLSAALWGGLLFVGGWNCRRRALYLRLLMPFVAVAMLNLARFVVPPTRVMLILLPWFLAIAAIAACRWRRQPTLLAIVPLLLAAGSAYAIVTPTLIQRDERPLFAPVRAIVSKVLAAEREPSAAASVRILAPLPTDIPTLFYITRAGQESVVNLNGTPASNEHVWLITRRDEPISRALADGVVGLPSFPVELNSWELRESVGALNLYLLRSNHAPQ